MIYEDLPEDIQQVLFGGHWHDKKGDISYREPAVIKALEMALNRRLIEFGEPSFCGESGIILRIEGDNLLIEGFRGLWEIPIPEGFDRSELKPGTQVFINTKPNQNPVLN